MRNSMTMMNLTTEKNASAFTKGAKTLLQSLLLITVIGLTACGGGRDGGNNFDGNGGINTGGGNPPTGGGTGTITPPANIEAQKVCFANSLYPLLTTSSPTATAGTNACAECHSGNPLVLGAPLFASADMDEAFGNLYNVRLDFINPAQSALIRKVNSNHYPTRLAADTAAAVTLLTTQVQKWADDCNNQGVQPTGTGIFSQVTTFSQANSLAGGGPIARYNDRTIALYMFDDAGGSDGMTVTDSSVLGTPLNLKLQGSYTWEADGGLTFAGGKAIASLADSKKIFDNIGGPAGTRQFSIEAWVTPDATQTADGTPYRLMTYSISSSRSNFTMGQIGQQADANAYLRFRNRSNYTGANGNNNSLNTADGSLPNTLTHIVMTFDETNGRKIYLDGNLVVSDNQAQTIRGNATATNNWDSAYRFVLGNEFSNADRNWKGSMKLMAVHDVALTEEQIKQNFNASIGGESVTLRFDISEHTGIANSYVSMVASEFGGNAYLFSNPIFEVTGGTSSIPVASNGDLLYSTYCQGCHGAAPGDVPDRTLAQIKAAIANVPTMQTTTLQGLDDAKLTLIETRVSAAYVAPLDSLALYNTNCSGCHDSAPGSYGASLAGMTSTSITNAIATVGAMNFITLSNAELTSIAAGNAAGLTLYANSCASCHGATYPGSYRVSLLGKTAADITAAIGNPAFSMNTAGLGGLSTVEIDEIANVFATAIPATGYNIQMNNIRVGVNGTTPPVGQALKNTSILLTDNFQAISSLGVVVPQSGGIATDSFFLEFERIALKSNVVVEAAPTVPPVDTTTTVVPVNGIRNFDQINDTMAFLTGVPKSTTNSSYVDLKSQLPGSNSILTFVASNQVVVMKHSLDYCTRMVDDDNNYFGTANPTPAQIQDLVVDKTLGAGLVFQPNRNAVRGDIYTLLTSIGCSGDGTVVTSCADMRKAKVTACVAGLSSATVTLY